MYICDMNLKPIKTVDMVVGQTYYDENDGSMPFVLVAYEDFTVYLDFKGNNGGYRPQKEHELHPGTVAMYARPDKYDFFTK